MQNAELLDRIATLEACVRELLDIVQELKTRPQPATIGGAGNNWPWPTIAPSAIGTAADPTLRNMPCGAFGAAGGPATPAGMNGSDK